MRGQAGENHRDDKPDQRQRHPAREKRGDRQERLHAGELAARSEQGDQYNRGKEPSGPVMPWEPRAQKSQQSNYACESTNPQNIKKGMHKTVHKSCLNIGLRQFILNVADRTSRAITWRGICETDENKAALPECLAMLRHPKMMAITIVKPRETKEKFRGVPSCAKGLRINQNVLPKADFPESSSMQERRGAVVCPAAAGLAGRWSRCKYIFPDSAPH